MLAFALVRLRLPIFLSKYAHMVAHSSYFHASRVPHAPRFLTCTSISSDCFGACIWILDRVVATLTFSQANAFRNGNPPPSPRRPIQQLSTRAEGGVYNFSSWTSTFSLSWGAPRRRGTLSSCNFSSPNTANCLYCSPAAPHPFASSASIVLSLVRA